MGWTECCYRRIVTTATHHASSGKPHIMSTITKFVNLFVTMCLVLVGFMHICLVIHDRNSFCDDVGCDHSDDCSCMGGFVVWNKKHGMRETNDSPTSASSVTWLSGVTETSNNYDSAGWGSVFTVEPVAFFGIWGPFMLALWGLCEHIHPFSPGIIYNPKRLFLWYIFMMMFVAFPCAGNWGVITAFLCLLPLICALIMMWVCPKQAVTFRGIYFGCYSYCIDDNETQVLSGGSGPKQHVHKVQHSHHEHSSPDMELLQMGSHSPKSCAQPRVKVKVRQGPVSYTHLTLPTKRIV
eukprot:TRINITY_DN4436_c0_g3_i2.p1 TRINITY_DN4436_c0_g3~~TRINITY_DN4436_c0_g3_i2.p1  ORF type:complete len:295 (-),score=32.96 TRINITY_DN4436_c0_g3_i2:139-1023(-)